MKISVERLQACRGLRNVAAKTDMFNVIRMGWQDFILGFGLPGANEIVPERFRNDSVQFVITRAITSPEPWSLGVEHDNYPLGDQFAVVTNADMNRIFKLEELQGAAG